LFRRDFDIRIRFTRIEEAAAVDPDERSRRVV
jgi:hypothetical protein